MTNLLYSLQVLTLGPSGSSGKPAGLSLPGRPTQVITNGKFMTPGVGILVLGRGHVSHTVKCNISFSLFSILGHG